MALLYLWTLPEVGAPVGQTRMIHSWQECGTRLVLNRLNQQESDRRIKYTSDNRHNLINRLVKVFFSHVFSVARNTFPREQFAFYHES